VKIEIKCDNCKKLFYRNERKAKKNRYNFCSVKCRVAFVKKNPYCLQQDKNYTEKLKDLVKKSDKENVVKI